VKYVQAVCQDFTKYCNCDLTLCYGDGKKTTVMMRYLDEPYKSSPVVKDKIMMFVRLVEKSDVAISSSTSSSSTTTTVLRAKESIYKHISLGTCSQGVQEVYIAPSSCTLYDIFNKNNNDDESIILMSVKNNQVQSPVEINPSHHRIKEFTSHDVFICINGDDDGGDDIVVDFESAVGSTSMKRSGGNNVESETMGAEKFLSPKRNRNSSSNSGGGGGGGGSNEKIITQRVNGSNEEIVTQRVDDWQHDLMLPKFRRKRKQRGTTQDMVSQSSMNGVSVDNNNNTPKKKKERGGHGTSSSSTNKDARKNGLPNLVGEKVMKHFEGFGDFYGEVVKFDADTGWYTVQYEDNDIEQLSFDDVIKYATFYCSSGLVPGTVDMSGSYYSSLSGDTPGKIAKKVGCDLKELLELNTMRLTESKRGLKASSKVWEKTIFFLPDTCDRSKLELLWGKHTVESYKALNS